MFNSKFTKKDSVAEEIEKIISERWDDDDEDDDVKRADAELRRMKAKPIEADKKTDPDKEIGKLAKKTPKEVDESFGSYGYHTSVNKPVFQKSRHGQEDRLYLHDTEHKSGDGKGHMLATFDKATHANDAAKKHGGKIEKTGLGTYRIYKEETVAEDKWTDIADGPWKKSNRSKSSAASAAANAAGKGLKGAQHKLDVAKPKGKLTAADFKKLRKENAEQIDELSRDLVQRYIRKTKPEYSSPSEIKKREGGRSLALKKAYGDKKFGLPEPKVKATEEVVIEKTLTPAESKKKEEIVKSMKKDKKGLKARYGKRWKEVAYATATKSAKRVAEDIEQIDELSKDTLTSYVGKASKSADKSYALAGSAASRGKSRDTKQFMKHAEKFGKRKSGIDIAKKKLSNEEVEQVTESYGDMSHAAKELVLHADNHPHLYHSSHTPIMNNLRKKMKKGEYHPEKAKKLWAYHADRAAQSYAKEHGDGKPWHKMFSTADRKAAASHWEDMHRHELNEAKGPGSDYGLETFATNPTNESPTSPLERAKTIARAALSKVKNEMLGKAGATSEEIDPRIKTTDTLKGRIKGGKDDDVGPGADSKSTKIKFTPGPK
jgi:hypothetical protein